MRARFLYLLLPVLMLLAPATAPAQTLASQIDPILDSLSNTTWSVLVQDNSGMVTYYERNKHGMLFPASNQKLFTTVAAMGLLGEDYAFETRIYADGSLSGGTLTGNIALLGEHDITWNTFCLNNSRDALDHIAQQLAAQGLSQVTGNVHVYGATYWHTGSTNTTHRLLHPNYFNATVAENFRDALVAAGISVGGSHAGMTGFTAPGDLIYTHFSTDMKYYNTRNGHDGEEIPLDLAAASIEINRPSHNTMADALMIHLGWKFRGESNLAAGAEVALEWLEQEAGIDTRRLEFADGSGLARNNFPTIDNPVPGNRASAKTTVEVVRYAVNNFRTFDTSLPVSCRTPTLTNRLCTPANLVGRVHAKTGSLMNTITLSGYLDHPTYGERIYFSFLANATSGSIDQPAARAAIDNAVRAIGGTFQPVAPTISHVVNAGDGESLDVHLVQQRSAVSSFTLQWGEDGSSFPNSTGLSPATPYIIETRSGQQNSGDYSEEAGNWDNSTAFSSAPGATGSGGSRWTLPEGVSGGEDARARFTPSGLPTGRYDVYVTSYGSNFLSDNAHGITIRFNDASGERERLYDISFETTGDVWAPIGTMDFVSGQGHFVEFDNATQLNRGTSLNSRMAVAGVRFVPTTISYTLDGLADGARRSFRATATGTSITSPPSNVYAGRASTDASRILVVDGNKRWVTQTNVNPTRANHAFADVIGRSISNKPFDTADSDAVRRGDVDLMDYEAVLYILGKESNLDQTFDFVERALVTEFLDNGGRLLVSGSEVGWDLDQLGTAAKRDFFENVLGMRYIQDDSGGTHAEPTSGSFLDGLPTVDFTAGPMAVNFPDELAAVGDAFEIMGYVSPGVGSAAVALDRGDDSRVVLFGFPIENLTVASEREAYMEALLDFLLDEEEDPITSTTWMIYN